MEVTCPFVAQSMAQVLLSSSWGCFMLGIGTVQGQEAGLSLQLFFWHI